MGRRLCSTLKWIRKVYVWWIDSLGHTYVRSQGKGTSRFHNVQSYIRVPEYDNVNADALDQDVRQNPEKLCTAKAGLNYTREKQLEYNWRIENGRPITDWHSSRPDRENDQVAKIQKYQMKMQKFVQHMLHISWVGHTFSKSMKNCPVWTTSSSYHSLSTYQSRTVCHVSTIHVHLLELYCSTGMIARHFVLVRRWTQRLVNNRCVDRVVYVNSEANITINIARHVV